MHEETKGDIDKDGRCRGVYSSVMQLYDALFHLAWMVFMIPFLGWTGMKEDWGVERDRGHIVTIEKLCHLHCQHKTLKMSHLTSIIECLKFISRQKWIWLWTECVSLQTASPRTAWMIISCCSCSQSIHPSLTICTFWLSYTVITLLTDFICLGSLGCRKKSIFVKASNLTHWAHIHTL